MAGLLEGTSFERVAVLLSCLFTAGAYLDAWSYVNNPAGISVLAPWQDISVHAGWFLLTIWLGLAMLVSLGRGAAWREALPTAYLIALAACGAYGLALIVDQYVQLASVRPIGLSRLLSPLPVVQVIAGALMVSAPLRAAWDRGDPVARAEAVVSAALVLSALTFILQFAHPFRDPWAAGAHPPAEVVWWIAEDFGVTSLLLQASLLTCLFMLLIRRFELRMGTFTTICLINGLLVAALKARWEMLVVALLTGLAADVLYRVLKPSLARTNAARLFAAAVPAVFTGAFFATTDIRFGIWWDWNLWAGVIVSSAAAGWLLSYLVFLPMPRLPSLSARPVAWPTHAVEVTANSVKDALEVLGQPASLAATPLSGLRFLTGSAENRGAELRELLLDIIRELETARSPRDVEAGRVLLDYYIRRVGTLEVVAERLHLSRPTLYRRLQRGFELVAERLDEMGEAGSTVDVWAGRAESKVENA